MILRNNILLKVDYNRFLVRKDLNNTSFIGHKIKNVANIILDQLDALKAELEAYRPGLSSKPAAIVANKIDMAYSQHHIDQLKVRNCFTSYISNSFMDIP